MTTGLVDTWLHVEEGGVEGCMRQRPIVFLFTGEGLKCTCIYITLPQTLKMPPKCDIVAVFKSTCTNIVQLKIRAMAFGFSL
jgi:hypothetical protein